MYDFKETKDTRRSWAKGYTQGYNHGFDDGFEQGNKELFQKQKGEIKMKETLKVIDDLEAQTKTLLEKLIELMDEVLDELEQEKKGNK